MTRVVCMLAALAAAAPSVGADRKVRVLVWDEQQPKQKEAYPDFLGNRIAEHLRKDAGLDVTSADIGRPEQGLSDKAVDEADVVVWWGHVRHKDVEDKRVARIVERVKEGKLGLVCLHSAHYSKVFKSAMLERLKQDALKALPEAERAAVEFVVQPKPGAPAVVKTEKSDGKTRITLVAPECGLGGWRADGMPGHIETKAPGHPIAKGLPAKFDIPRTEMYNESFKVPEPDTVVFFETWDKGEKFRSGCCWDLGKGRVFYYRPGHETYPVYHQDENLLIVRNAVFWAAGK